MAKETWTAGRLADFYSEEPGRAAMKKILDWAMAEGRFVETEAKAPLFSVAGSTGRKLFAIFSSGHVYVWMDASRFDSGESGRDQLVEALRDVGLLEPGFDVSSVKEGKTLIRTTSQMDDITVDRLIGLMARY